MTINQEIMNITEAIKNAIPVEKIYLFGSFAYGMPTKDSDYDFFVVIPNDSMRPIEAMQKARKALIYVEHKTPVDILADYEKRFNERKDTHTLEKAVFSKGVLLYDQA